MERPYSRREACTLLAATAATAAWAQVPEPAGRKLDFRIGDDFGGANAADITAVLRSAGDAIWKHCPNTKWNVPGFFIFHSAEHPITVFDHRADGRIAIGLATQGTLWSQFAYQFSHEFCHALAGHADDWRSTWIRAKKANHWLEESFCETASLFAMRAMAQSWRTNAPYPNWKSYAESLASYVADRLSAVAKGKGPDFAFAGWFRENEPAMRENSTNREKNNVVAVALLPLFEAEPAGWEAMAFFNRCENRDPAKTLARHIADWAAAAPEKQRTFIKRVGAIFGV